MSGVHVSLANSHALNSGVPNLPIPDTHLQTSNDVTSLMERFITSNSDNTLQEKMNTIIQLIRNEFAFDGYMENGVEDMQLGEQVGGKHRQLKKKLVKCDRI